MKKDKKYFMDKLSCGISRMKRDNTIEELTGPVTTFVSYGEMMHGSLENYFLARVSNYQYEKYTTFK